MRDNERDALLALAAEIRASLGNGTTVSTRRRWAIEIEALAAPAEGGRVRKAGDVSPHSDVVLLADMSSPPAASVDVEAIMEVVENYAGKHSSTSRYIRQDLAKLIDSAGGAKCGHCGKPKRADRALDACACATLTYTPQPAEGDGALAARLESHQTNYSANMDKDAYDALSQAIAILKSRPAATAQVAASWDTRALDVARLFTHASETQRRARLQCAVLDAMQWAAALATGEQL